MLRIIVLTNLHKSCIFIDIVLRSLIGTLLDRQYLSMKSSSQFPFHLSNIVAKY